MRRVLRLLASSGLLATVIGCHHTAGVCDCAPPPCGKTPGCVDYNPTCASCSGCGQLAPPGAPAILPGYNVPHVMPKTPE